MKNISAILALLILLTVSLACSDSGDTTATKDNTTTAPKTESGATVKSVTMMNAGDETVTSFKPSDMTQKFVVEFNASGAGKVKGVFTAVNAGGEKNLQILEKEMNLTNLLNTANFTASMEQPFPTGDYKLDVYLNDKLVKTHNYKVQ